MNGTRVDIPAERSRIERRLSTIRRPLHTAWVDGIGTVTLKKLEAEVQDEVRQLKRRLSALKQLEKKRMSHRTEARAR